MSDPQAHSASIEQAVRSQRWGRLRDALYDVGEHRHTDLAPLVLTIGERTRQPETQEYAAWTLGKLGYASALPFLVRMSQEGSRGVVKAACWALGELGGARAEAALLRVKSHPDADDLAQVIGGALKKIRGESVRAYAGHVSRRLEPPKSTKPEANQIVQHLETASLSMGQGEILELRERLQTLDPEFFKQYMKFVSEKSKVRAWLRSDRVY